MSGSTVLDARRIAWRVVERVEQGGAFANKALDAALQEAGKLDPRDAALATELTYGTLRRQIAIDHALVHFSKVPLAEVEHGVRALLRIGAYQLMYLRMPAHASVHATVELAKEHRNGRAVTYVNAVLRALARDRENVLVPPAGVDPVGHLSISLSMPRWLCEEFHARYGLEEAKLRLDAYNHPAPFQVRVNRVRGDRAAAAQELGRITSSLVGHTRHSPAGLVLEESGSRAALLRPDEGRWQAQDEAAQLVGFYAAPRAGQRVLDACAAPGGKTCHLGELMDDSGHVDACDVHANKLKDVADGARKLGLTIVSTYAADATKPLPFAEGKHYDLVLADVPCSGLGTLRRHPELKVRRTAEDVARLAALQSQILDVVAPLVKPGGVLVYSTCTVAEAECAKQVDAFLLRHPEFRRAGPPPADDRFQIDWAPLVDANGDLQLDPHTQGTDGFYASRLVRAA